MLTLEGHVVNEVEFSRWDELTQEFPEATVFHSLAWLQAIRKCHGARIILLQASCDGECQALWPCLELRKGPLRVLGSPLPGWSTAYMGPVFRPGADVDAALRTFLDHKIFRKAAYLACKSLNTGPRIDLARYGFVNVLDFDTYIIDLSLPEEQLWANLKSECRTRIRKAEKLGLQVREEHDGQFIDDYWSMSLETFANTNIQPTFTRQFAEEMWRQLREVNRVRALSAWMNGERIGMLVLPFDAHTMYYWGGASYARVRGIPAHNILHWEAFKLGQRLGLRRYDFVSTVGGAGRFKKTFGPQCQTVASHWERSQSRLIELLKSSYENYLLRRRRLKT